MSEFDVGRNPIQQRIVCEFLATAGLVLLLTAGALSGTAFLQFQDMTNENLIGVARVIGGNSKASLLFNAGQAVQASETVSDLAAHAQRLEEKIDRFRL